MPEVQNINSLTGTASKKKHTPGHKSTLPVDEWKCWPKLPLDAPHSWRPQLIHVLFHDPYITPRYTLLDYSIFHFLSIIPINPTTHLRFRIVGRHEAEGLGCGGEGLLGRRSHRARDLRLLLHAYWMITVIIVVIVATILWVIIIVVITVVRMDHIFGFPNSPRGKCFLRRLSSLLYPHPGV